MEVYVMYEYNENQLILPHEFFLPFGGQLNPKNRWVLLSQIIPWAKIEEKYLQALGDTTQGQKAYSVRLALGALIIKERMGLSDVETVEQITENPYLQYFIGLSSFQEEAPFHPSSMTHFRKRFGAGVINQVNEWVVEAEQAKTKDTDKTKDDDNDLDNPNGSGISGSSEQIDSHEEKPKNQGKMLVDATCAPADIAYPTDLSLLNDAREKLEGVIDTLHEPQRGTCRKPRTYRKKARKQYLAVAKQRNPRKKTLRKAVRQQLNHVRRNLKHIQNLVQKSSLELLSKQQYRDLLVIHELYRQQKNMFDTKSNRIDDRIVSIQQPHVRPIVRGKTSARVEFGAKISVSLVDGFSFLDVLDWNAYHEGNYLVQSIEAYFQRYGFYPEAVLVDQIYRTRENREYCKEHGIRLSGPRLGRPSKNEQKNREQKRIEYQDAVERNPIEGKFGEGKRSYGLGLIQSRLQQTSETEIALQFLVMNLEKILRDTFLSFFQIFFSFLRQITIHKLSIFYKVRVVQ